MPVLFKRSPERFFDLQLEALEKLGLSTRAADGEVSQAISASTRDVLALVYSEIYILGDNMLASEAQDRFLDRYGEMLGEDRRVTTPAKDLSLNNVYITLPDLLTAEEITIDAGTIQIDAGFEITNNDGSVRARVINSPVFPETSNRAFCQIIVTSGQADIPANVFNRASISLTQVPNIDITKIQTGTVNAVQPNNIGEVDVNRLTDNQFQFVLLNAAEGLGNGNLASVRTELLRIPTVASFDIKEHTHGNSSITVFVQSTELQFDDEFLEAIKIRVQNVIAAGTRVRIEQPELITIGLVFTMQRAIDADQVISLKNVVQGNINNLAPGEGLTITTINSWVDTSGFRGTVTLIQRNNRDIPLQDITIRSFEKLVALTASDIIVQ